MKIKNNSLYKIASPERNKELIRLGHKVVIDKKKQRNKYCCRKGK